MAIMAVGDVHAASSSLRPSFYAPISAFAVRKTKNKKVMIPSINCPCGGFGKSFSLDRSGNIQPIISLSSQAKSLLKKHDNNVDAASDEHFRDALRDNSKNRYRGNHHAARVAAAWDTVALFLPNDYSRTKGRVEPYVDRRLGRIVQACCSDEPDMPSMLDVGCGDGAVVPYLPHSCSYIGIDLSREMIQLAERRHPAHKFAVGNFPEDVTSLEREFYAVLFNGSLQFFRQTRQVLAEASKLAKHRIVLSHVEGSHFVKQECRNNPTVAVRPMPSVDELEDWILPSLEGKWNIVSDKDNNFDNADLDPKQFYLVVLEKQEIG